MYVGYMRNFINPKKFTRLLAKTTKYHGIDLLYFHPNDINMENKVINGQVLINNKWVRKEVPIPKFVDVTVYSFKYKKQIKFLKENSHFTTGRLGSKDITIEKLKEDGEFAHLLIPTINYSDFKSFHNFLKKYRQIVMKPRRGAGGVGVYKLSINKRKYILSHKNNEELITKKQLKNLFMNTLTEKPYIFQKYINSKTKNGNPFDCRIRLEKNGVGKWEVVINLIRIGSGQKVVSNVVQGGSISYLDSFLKSNYKNQWQSIKESINEVGKNFPQKIEELYNQELSSLGIDIGIDTDGKLYLFESNNAPGLEGAWGEIALVKCDYYKYMLDKLSK